MDDQRDYSEEAGNREEIEREQVAEASTPELVRMFATLRVRAYAGTGERSESKKLAVRLSLVVTELRRRGVLDDGYSTRRLTW